MNPSNVNPSPKARFQAVEGNKTQHRAMIERESFDKSTDAALLEYQKQLAAQTVDGNTAMAAGFRLQGAVEFLSLLKTLAESFPMPAPRRDPDNLPSFSPAQPAPKGN